MGQVLIRNLDDSLIEDFRRVARTNGRSLEAELREALAQARPRDTLVGAPLRSLVESLWEMTPERAAQVDSTPLIRQSRDEA
jgi:plasmid stability protein